MPLRNLLREPRTPSADAASNRWNGELRMRQFSGLPVEERLVMSGLNFSFWEAANFGDRMKMVEILIGLEMTTHDASKAADRMLASPDLHCLIE